MKKIFYIATILFAIGLVSAIYNQSVDDPTGQARSMQYGNDPEMEQYQGNGSMGPMNGINEFEKGNEYGINLRLRERLFECENCSVFEENGTLKYQLSNGRNALIKIMPETASEKAIETLKLRNCDNCSIELKEVATKNNSTLTYEIRTRKQVKLFGLFSTEEEVEAQIDTESGKTINTKRPWWSFLASNSEE